jgi:hypothetical protein
VNSVLAAVMALLVILICITVPSPSFAGRALSNIQEYNGASFVCSARVELFCLASVVTISPVSPVLQKKMPGCDQIPHMINAPHLLVPLTDRL